MSYQSRRSFLNTAGFTLAVTSFFGFSTKTAVKKPMKNIFVHHVYFWLKNADSAEDRAKLLEGLEKLSKVKSIRSLHMGKPADTSRDVIDGSYTISWLTVFKNKADQDSYQVDPIHLAFVKDYAHLWSKVVVYDSVDV